MNYRTLNDVMTPLHPENLEQWQEMREKIIENIRFASSVDLMKNDAPLEPRVFGAVEYEDFVIEKVIFQSLPGYFVTGSLYRPKDISKKYPAVLNPHGHWQFGRHDTDPLARIPLRLANFAKRGMVAFIYDMIGFGDSSQIPHENHEDSWDCYNYGRFSLQLNNSIKAVDFVSLLPYVDSEKIGCTGCSGGGTQTYFLAAIDERIKAAAPINMASCLMQGGCICENNPFLRIDYNNIDYTSCIAPRPLFLSASDGDWTRGCPEVEFPAVKYIYSLYGKEENFSSFYQSAPHCYNQPIRERVYEFFCGVFGINNPSQTEYELEIDNRANVIGEIEPYTGNEIIHSDSGLFSLVSSFIEKNYASLDCNTKNKYISRVFGGFEFSIDDIGYSVKKDSVTTLTLKECPPDEKTDIKYFSCYNYSPDTLRVVYLLSLLKQFSPDFVESTGKTAALAVIAMKLYGKILPGISLPDFDKVYIPGLAFLELTENME